MKAEQCIARAQKIMTMLGRAGVLRPEYGDDFSDALNWPDQRRITLELANLLANFSPAETEAGAHSVRPDPPLP